MKQEILAALSKNTLKPYSFEGVTVYLRQFTGHDRRYLASLGKEASEAQIVVKGVVDEQGKPVFTDQDCKALGESNGVLLQRLAMAVLAHNDADVEAAEKN